jgi:hypothetical protein
MEPEGSSPPSQASDLVLLSLSHNDSLIIRVAGLTAAEFLNILLPVLGFVLLRVARAFVLLILCDICLLPA